MRRVSSPTACIGIVAAVLLTGLNGGLRADRARADACLAAPKGTAPAGQHWYYRLNRAKGRKCWYLHGHLHLTHHLAAQSRLHATAARSTNEQLTSTTAQPVPTTVQRVPTNEQPAAMAPQPAVTNAQPASPEEQSAPSPQPTAAPATPAVAAPAAAAPVQNVPAEPHITILTVRTVATPGASAPAQEAGQPAAPAHTDLPAAPQMQSTTTAGKAEPTHAGSDGAQNKSAQTVDRTAMPRPGEMYLLMAIAFGITVFLLAAANKIAARRREPILCDHPDVAWSRQFGRRPVAQQSYEAPYDERDAPSIDPQRQQELADLRRRERTDRRRPASYSPAPPEDLAAASAERPRPRQKDIEPALRALRQARQDRVA